jgi:hypothetical protein
VAEQIVSALASRNRARIDAAGLLERLAELSFVGHGGGAM